MAYLSDSEVERKFDNDYPNHIHAADWGKSSLENSETTRKFFKTFLFTIRAQDREAIVEWAEGKGHICKEGRPA